MKAFGNGEFRARRMWAGIIATAFGLSVMAFAILLRIEKAALDTGDMVKVCVAGNRITEGTIMEEESVSKYFDTLDVPAKYVPAGAVICENDLAGLKARINIEKGTLLTSDMFEDVSKAAKELRNPVVASLRADDLYQIVGGILRSGDRVSLYTVTSEGEIGYSFEEVYVLQSFDAAGNEIEVSDHDTPAQRVNLLIDSSRVKTLYSELSRGSLRMVKVYE